MSQKKRIFVRGIGAYLPERVLTNAQLEKMVDTNDEWIVTRTGIRERRIATDDQATSDLATAAARDALADAGLTAADVDAIMVSTVTPDMFFPSTACCVQQQLGCSCCPCMDFEVGCSGVPYGLELAAALLERGNFRNILVIAADKLSTITDWTDRNTCVLLADGACAMILSTEQKGARAELLGTHLDADGSGGEFLCMPGGGSRCPARAESVESRQHFLKMNGRETFKRAVKAMALAAERLLEKCQISVDQVKLFFPHQANIRIIEAMAEYAHLSLERFWVVLSRTGNTSSASVGIALKDAVSKNQLQENDFAVLVAFGGGMTSGAALLRFLR